MLTLPEDKSSSTNSLISGTMLNSSSGGVNNTNSGTFSSSSSTGSNGGNLDTNACNVYTFQAMSEEDYKLWMDALDAKDPYPPVSSTQQNSKANKQANNGKGDHGLVKAGLVDASLNDSSYVLDEEGYFFVKKCISGIEAKGLEHKGIYRIVGVTSKVRSLMEQFVEHRKKSSAKNGTSSSLPVNCGEDKEVDLLPNLNFESDDYETKTITSALKNYLRNLVEPLMTFQLHTSFIAAASMFQKHVFRGFIFVFFLQNKKIAFCVLSKSIFWFTICLHLISKYSKY